MNRQTHRFAPRADMRLASALLLFCCCLASPARAADEELAIALPSEVAALTERYQTSLKSALDTGEAQRAEWRKLVWRDISCYEPKQVERTLAAVKREVRLAAARDPRLSALQSYVDERFAVIGRMPPTMLINQPSVFPGKTRRVPGVQTDAADSAWRELRDFIESFLGAAPLAVDLSVTSEPSGAQVDLRAGRAAVSKLSVATSAQLRNVWRGLYRVSVEKAGYKSTVLDLDLVNQGSLDVSCTLAEAQSSEESRCAQKPRE